jgi:hypothetical protein
MTKSSTQTLLTALFLVLLIACGTKKETTATETTTDSTSANTDEWKAMDDFHMIMAESFHPYKDSANLAPAKAKATELATAAEQWLAAPLPEKVNNQNVKTKLEALKTKTAAFVETSKSTDDKVVGDALTELHDMFHELQEAWYAGRGEHHH